MLYGELVGQVFRTCTDAFDQTQHNRRAVCGIAACCCSWYTSPCNEDLLILCETTWTSSRQTAFCVKRRGLAAEAEVASGRIRPASVTHPSLLL